LSTTTDRFGLLYPLQTRSNILLSILLLQVELVVAVLTKIQVVHQVVAEQAGTVLQYRVNLLGAAVQQKPR
jgi:hypothetical protein